MADNKPPQPGNGGEDSPKLPPRSGDWQSGLKKSDPEKKPRMTAPDTVSDFVAGKDHVDSDDWDPVDSDENWKSQYPQSQPASQEKKEYVSKDKTTTTETPGIETTTTTAAVAPNVHDDDIKRPRRDFSFYTTSTRFTDFLIAAILAVLAFVSVAFTYNGFGHSWDEALYLKPAERAAAWMVGTINSGDDSMMSRDTIARHWGSNLSGHDPLHPEVAPVPKLLPGAGLTYLQKPLQVDEMTAMRLPNAILFGLTIALLFLLGTREYGRIGGFAAAFFYALMPRVFGHAHIAASETPLAFCVVLTVWCFLVANRFWPFALFTGIAFGLAIATKVTALALFVPLMLWGQVYKRREYGSNVFAMIFIAPLIALAMWPWLWYDTFERFVNYLGFYLHHQKTAVFYMGRTWGYGRPDAPFYYAPHITALVVPVWMLFFVALGLIRALFSTISRPVTVLFVLMTAFWIGLAMLPGAPRYDGERLWFPAFAFIGLLAGGGFSLLFSGVRRWRDRRELAGAARETSYMAVIALVVFGIYGVVDLFITHPNELNYYNWITGRTKGAYDKKAFETSYWGEAVNDEVTSYLGTILKPGDKVKTLALNEEAFENLRRWGKLPEKVDFSPDMPPYDYAILQVRQGFMTQRERELWLGREPLKVFEAGGVPRIMIFDATTIANVFPAPEGESVSRTVSADADAEDGSSVSPMDSASQTTGTAVSSGVTSETAPGAVLTTSGATIQPINSDMTTAAATRANDRETTEAIDQSTTPDTTTATAVLDLPDTSTQTLPEPALETNAITSPDAALPAPATDADLPSPSSSPDETTAQDATQADDAAPAPALDETPVTETAPESASSPSEAATPMDELTASDDATQSAGNAPTADASANDAEPAQDTAKPAVATQASALPATATLDLSVTATQTQASDTTDTAETTTITVTESGN